MIYTSHYFGIIKGIPTPISLSVPEVGYRLADRLPFFCPTPAMLKYWKDAASTPEADTVRDRYKADFVSLLKNRWIDIHPWLNSLDPEVDVTLLCWEKDDDRCHRRFVGKLIEGKRPDCWGGELKDFELPAPAPAAKPNRIYRVGDRVRLIGNPRKAELEIQTHSPLIGWEFTVEEVDPREGIACATVPDNLTPPGVGPYFGFFPFEYLEQN